jgi:predicted aminopeptidase
MRAVVVETPSAKGIGTRGPFRRPTPPPPLGNLRPIARRVAAVGVAALAFACAGCGAGYLLRASCSEARILWRREPIERVLARGDLDEGLRERLALVLVVRRFAADGLGLRVGESYSTFADVGGDGTVHVLSAAYRDRLEAYTWWYPVVGRAPYRGFFERADAEAAARRLEARGLDVDVRPASAFSTLGWFADPLLSTTADYPPVVLAEIVIHELFHATLYLPGETAFNESAATFAGHRGAIALFCGDGPLADPARCAEARTRWSRLRAHARLLDRYVRRLRALYAGALPAPRREARRRGLAAAADRALVRRRLAPPGDLSPPNNARLLAAVVYETDLDAFDRLAPTDAAVAGALARVIAAARGASDPLAAVRALPQRASAEPSPHEADGSATRCNPTGPD